VNRRRELARERLPGQLADAMCEKASNSPEEVLELSDLGMQGRLGNMGLVRQCLVDIGRQGRSGPTLNEDANVILVESFDCLLDVYGVDELTDEIITHHLVFQDLHGVSGDTGDEIALQRPEGQSIDGSSVAVCCPSDELGVIGVGDGNRDGPDADFPAPLEK